MEGTYKFVHSLNSRSFLRQLRKSLPLLFIFYLLFVGEWTSHFLFFCIVSDEPSVHDVSVP
jgi:hypothetical protein